MNILIRAAHYVQTISDVFAHLLFSFVVIEIEFDFLFLRIRPYSTVANQSKILDCNTFDFVVWVFCVITGQHKQRDQVINYR